MKSKKQSGQILLIVLMLLTTALTIVFSTAFKSTTDTQITKLEQESQRALAAAEAAIEERLRLGTDVVIGAGGGQLNLGTAMSGYATLDTSSYNYYISPYLRKDDQLTFYLVDYISQYNTTTREFTTGYSSGNDIEVYFSQNPSCMALEFTLINRDGTSVKRFLANPVCDAFISGNGLVVSSGPFTVNGETFNYKVTLSAAQLSGNSLLIARVITTIPTLTSKIEFTSLINLPSQGNVVTGEAQSLTGDIKVTKEVNFIQQYPQIPSDFFLTSF